MKSEDTEEWLDVYFTRPVGLAFALVWRRLGVHPNVVTVIGIVLGLCAAYMFLHDSVAYNAAGIVLMMFSNFCDSTDGQLARLTGQKTLVGRVLDGLSGDIVFFFIYVALCLRLMPCGIPGTDVQWGWSIFVVGVAAGVFSHSPQASLSDYYRQIHLFFLKGASGSELDNYNSQRKIFEQTPKSRWLARAFYYNYAGYCRSQERRTPCFQKMMARLSALTEASRNNGSAGMAAGGSVSPAAQTAAVSPQFREDFLAGSRPLMPYTNLLTFNSRAVCIYVTCLLGCPWVYFLLEITVYNIMYFHMRRRHEALCAELTERYLR